MTATKLGRMQLQIVKVLWERGRSTAREITDAMNESEEVAHSTVQTLLRTLEEKGAVDHDVEGRTFVFYPVVKEDKVRHSATRELLQRLFDGNVADLVSYLIQNEEVSRNGLDEIRAMIDSQRKSSRKK